MSGQSLHSGRIVCTKSRGLAGRNHAPRQRPNCSPPPRGPGSGHRKPRRTCTSVWVAAAPPGRDPAPHQDPIFTAGSSTLTHLATLTGTTPAAEIHTHQVAEPRKEKAIQRNALRATRDPSAARAPLSSSGCVQGLYYQRATKKSSHQAPSWTGLLVEAPQGHPYRRTQSVHYLRARRFSTMKWQTETNFYFKHPWLALSSPRQPAGSLTVV